MNPFEDLKKKQSVNPFSDVQKKAGVFVGGIPVETETQKQQRIQGELNPVQNVGLGIVKGVLSTARGIGEFGTKTAQTLLPKSLEPQGADIYNPETEVGARVKEALAPQGTGQNIGFFTEKTAEFLAPSSLVSKAQGAVTGAVQATKLPGIVKGALGVAGRAAPEAISAGGVSLIQEGGDMDTAARNAGIAGAVSGALGTVGAAYRGVKSSLLGADDARVLIKAIKPTGTLANKDYQNFKSGLPRAIELVKQTDIPVTDLNSLKAATDAAKKQVWSKVIQQTGGEEATIDGYNLARSIYSTLDDNSKLLLENPEVRKDVLEMAMTYADTRLTVPQAEDLLEQTNAFLRAANASHPSPSEVATLSLVKQMNLKLSEALRENIDNVLESVGKGAVKPLRQDYARLAQLSRAVNERIPKDERLSTMSLGEQFNMPVGIGKILSGVVRGDIGSVAEGSTQIAAGRFAKGLNQSDELINQVFQGKVPGAVSSRVFGNVNKNSPGYRAGQELTEQARVANKQGGFLAIPGGPSLDDIARNLDEQDVRIMRDFIDDIAQGITPSKEVAKRAQDLADLIGLQERFGTNKELSKVFGEILDYKKANPARNVPITVVKESDDLLSVARKYDTAEEFVKAQPMVYHGSNVPIKKFSNEQGTFFTDDMMNADGYAGGENVYEGYLNLKNPLVIDAKGALHRQLDTKWGKTTQEVVANVDKSKYDGVIFKNIKDSWIDDADVETPGTIYYAFKPRDSFLSEFQLTDIWKKAHNK